MISRAVASDVPLDMVTCAGEWGIRQHPNSLTWASTAFEAATRTAYFPIFIPVTCTVKRFFWTNGTDVAGGATIQAALYRDGGYKPGARIGTNGSVTQGTASTVQFVAPSSGDFVVSPGLVWFALASSSATNTTLMAVAQTLGVDASFRFQEATATPPSSATPVASTSANLYLAGFSTTTLT